MRKCHLIRVRTGYADPVSLSEMQGCGGGEMVFFFPPILPLRERNEA